ncbi:MAG: protein kinase [Planctomycetota bacterium]
MPTDTDPLAARVQRYLERIEAGEDAAAAQSAERPRDADSAQRFDDAIQRLRDVGLERTAVTAEGNVTPPWIGDYELLRPLGVGGMGVVHLARESPVDRPVALKLLRADQRFDGQAHDRFRREVEVVASLAHPSVATLFAFGEFEGCPYCAMEYVPGASLDVVLRTVIGTRVEALAGRDLLDAVERDVDPGANPPSEVDPALFEGSWVHACLRIAHAAALALDHAHGRGVLHRDVKPSNLMVTPGGRVVLLDFGLAGLVGRGDLTRTGATLGSLPYMAPEQASGRMSEVDERTDVYGLGVTLYELLTLRAPFAGRHPEDVRRRVLDGHALAPSRLHRDLDVDVEVVVLKAMDPLPSRRYASARDLARDVANILARRPIEARPAGPWVRLDRFVRRRPAAAVAWALGGVLVIGGPLGFGVVQATHRAELGDALEETETHFETALAAVAEVLRPLSDDALVDLPGVQELRVRTYRRALEHLEPLAESRPDDARVVEEGSKLRTGLGLALVESGKVDEGLALLHRAETDWFRLVDASAVPARILAGAAGTSALRARFEAASGRIEEALASFDRAAELAERTLALEHDDADVLMLAAEVHDEIAEARRLALPDSAGAEELERVTRHLRRSEAYARRAIDARPERARGHAILAETLRDCAQATGASLGPLQGVNAEHVAWLADSFASYERALELDPNDRRIALGHAKVQREWADALISSGQVARGLEELRATARSFARLAEAYPDVRDFRSGQLLTLEGLVPHARTEEEALALSVEVADGKIALAESMDRPGIYHLAAAAGQLNTAVRLVSMRTEVEDALRRAEARLESARGLIDDVGPTLRPRSTAELSTLIELAQATVHAQRKDVAGTLGCLGAAAESDGGTSGYVAMWRGVSWIQASAALEGVEGAEAVRDQASERAREAIDDALALGIPRKALLERAELAPLLER